MTQAEAKQRIARLVVALDQLRPSQIGWIEAVVAQLQRATAFSRWEKSDLVTPCVLDDFGDALRIHHCFSAEPFSKDKFEPPRLSRRLHHLRGWSHEDQTEAVPG